MPMEKNMIFSRPLTPEQAPGLTRALAFCRPLPYVCDNALHLNRLRDKPAMSARMSPKGLRPEHRRVST